MEKCISMNHNNLVKDQFEKLLSKYKYFCLLYSDGMYYIKGRLYFCVIYKEETIEDSFDLEIMIPEGYPNDLPTVKETERRIPKRFHINPDGTLCLGTILAQKMKFSRNPTILGFIDDLIIPFLFSYIYFCKYRKMPYGEYAHGIDGIIQHYKELFEVSSNESVVCFLELLSKKSYRGHYWCPCGSGKRVRNCHADIIKNLMNDFSEYDFKSDYYKCKEHIK